MSYRFYLEDLVRGTRINKYFNENKKLDNLTSDMILELQNIKLKRLVDHAYKNIPWYNSEMNRLGITPADIQSRTDIGRLPILTRDIIREHYKEMLWSENAGKTFSGSSSGTTGIPINYLHDINGFSAGVAAGNTLMGYSGWTPGMRVVHLWGNSESVKEWSTLGSRIKQKIYSKKNIPSALLNNCDNLEYVVNLILKHKPKLIEGYSNSIFEIAKYLLDNKIKIPSVKYVITTAENLGDYQRSEIEKVLAPVTDLYGCGEINGIACRPAGEEKYYILDHHVFVETNTDYNNGMKEIIVTDLDNFGMPFIRYQVGDMIGDITEGSDLNSLPYSSFTNIFGRSSDYILLTNGKKLFPINIFGGTLFRKYPSITRHKTTWDGKKLGFIFESQIFNDMVSLEKDIRHSLADFDVDFEITLTMKLFPGKNGKYRYFELL